MVARVLIMAGGTGGHVFPALAVAEQLRARGLEVAWMGTAKGLEARVVPEAGIALLAIPIAGLRGKGLAGWLLAPLRLTVAVARAMQLLRRQRPAVVLGMGGFVAGPGGVASRLLGRPLVIHEQNAVAGLTNKLLSRLATRVLEAFPGTFRAGTHAVHTGNPVREAIAALPAPDQRWAGRSGRLRLLVIGGSLGAAALNETLPAALRELPAERRPEVWHQTGAATYEATAARYREVGVEARVVAFIDDMAAAYGWADVALCRAGALTVAELAAAGLGAVLVPYPHAVDDHQSRNAEYLTAAGAALAVPQTELTAERLAGLLAQFDRQRLLKMARAARERAVNDATARVVQHCLEVARD